MGRTCLFVCVAALFLVTASSSRSQESPAVPQQCESIEGAGICDPYVPGTIIVMPRNKAITVPRGRKGQLKRLASVLAIRSPPSMGSRRSRRQPLAVCCTKFIPTHPIPFAWR
jgi:hypothetical protein